MKIFADKASSSLSNYIKEPGWIGGSNDLLKGEQQTCCLITYPAWPFSLCGPKVESYIVEPKLYLHIFRSPWSSFTGMLREYCLPWRWHSVYLDRENGTPPERILVCVSLKDRYSGNGKFSKSLLSLLGKTLFVTNLIKAGFYHEMFSPSVEYLKISDGQIYNRTTIHPFLGNWGGYQWASNSPHRLCQIYRIRGIFSFLKYQFLKNFSREWEEASIRVNQISENLLIKRNDRTTVLNSGLMNLNS